MELSINQILTNKNKYYLSFYVLLMSFIFSLINISDTSLMFIIPLLYLCFVCGYIPVFFYFIGLIISTVIFNHSLMQLYICILSFAFINVCQYIKIIKYNYIPFILTLICGSYYAFNQDYLLMTIILTIMTYINIVIFSTLIPVFMHYHATLLTHERIKALSVCVMFCIIALYPYSSMFTFILIRVYMLILIYYALMNDLLPALFYTSFNLLLIDLSLKDQILSLLIPLFFFYMINIKSKYTYACIYLLSHICLPFFIDFSYEREGVIIVSSVIIFLLMPLKKHYMIPQSFKELTVLSKVNQQIESFSQLLHKITQLFHQAPIYNYKLEYINHIYDDLCIHCSSKNTCFNSKLGNNRLIKLMNKGLEENLNKDDLSYIKHYCISPQHYIRHVQSYSKEYLHIKRQQDEYIKIKDDLYQQFSLISEVFNDFSKRLQDRELEDHSLLEYLQSYHYDIIYLKKYYESQSVFYIELGIKNIREEQITLELIPLLETYINSSLQIETIHSSMNQLGYTYLILKHAPSYYIQHGIAQCAKENQVCGDSYHIFSYNEHKYYALSDGMGVGHKAKEDSSLTLEVIKRLIVNGISLKDTLHSVNALLKIKNRNDMFTTLDMIDINEVNAQALLIKYGSSPTYILRNHQVIEIEAQSLPIGIMSSLELYTQKKQLLDQDIIFILSDGFDVSFKTFLLENEYIIKDEHPKDIASILLQLALTHKQNDDMTLIVLKVCKKG